MTAHRCAGGLKKKLHQHGATNRNGSNNIKTVLNLRHTHAMGSSCFTCRVQVYPRPGRLSTNISAIIVMGPSPRFQILTCCLIAKALWTSLSVILLNMVVNNNSHCNFAGGTNSWSPVSHPLEVNQLARKTTQNQSYLAFRVFCWLCWVVFFVKQVWNDSGETLA